MGPAHSTVTNRTENKICVITFTYTDLQHVIYNNLYVIEPGASKLVESQPDATGLKIAVIYDVSIKTNEIKYQLFTCKTNSVLIINQIDYNKISWIGDNITGYKPGIVIEQSIAPLTMAYEAVHNLPLTSKSIKYENTVIQSIPTDYVEYPKTTGSNTTNNRSSASSSGMKRLDSVSAHDSLSLSISSSNRNYLKHLSRSQDQPSQPSQPSSLTTESTHIDTTGDNSPRILHQSIHKSAEEKWGIAEAEIKQCINENKQELLKSKHLLIKQLDIVSKTEEARRPASSPSSEDKDRNNELVLYTKTKKSSKNKSSSSANKSKKTASVDAINYQINKMKIIEKRVVFRGLPVLCENDLVHGSWWYFWGSALCILIPVMP